MTVAGLMAGKDIVDQLHGMDVGDVVFVPSVAVRDGAFLDDVTLGDVEAALGCPVCSVEPLPHVLARRIVSVA